jgi:hypothetical protein
MILRPAPVQISTFTWDPRTRTLSAEASELPPFGRVYDDACDVGFTVLGHHAEVVFALQEEHRDREGDVTHWTFVPAKPGERSRVTTAIKLGAPPAVSIVVWND